MKLTTPSKSIARSIAGAIACAQLVACIVNQPLGERGDGATTPTDSAPPTDTMPTIEDSAAPTDTMPTIEDSAAPRADVPPMPTDASADVMRADAAVVDVRAIEILAATTRPIPALGNGATSVQIIFRDRPATTLPSTVLERSGDCVLQEIRPVPNAPPPTLDGVTIRVTTPGGTAMIARRDSFSTSDHVVARYTVNFPSPLPPGTMLRVEVDAFGSVPSFSRDVLVTDVRYAPPSPVTDTPMARYLTRTAGQPMPIALQFSGAMMARSVFDVVMMSTEGLVRELRCELPARATSTTVASSLLDRAAPFANTAVGGASVFLVGIHDSTSSALSNGTTVSIMSSATLVSGLRI